MKALEKEIQDIINRCSAENESNTPDFILAQYLVGCLSAWNTAVQQREKWYGRNRESILKEIMDERNYQESKWCSDHDKDHCCYDWSAFIIKYLARAIEEPIDKEKFHTNMVKIAALCIAGIEAIETK